MKITFKDKIVAFIDVLGFSNMVYSETVTAIDKYFTHILKNFDDAAQKHKINYHLISDSIVISVNHDKNSLKMLVKSLCILQSQLFLNGILVRGAISFGGLYLNKSKNIIVGLGLINAYKLESQARYPRIIIDRRLITQYYDGTPSALKDLSWVLYKGPAQYCQDFLYLDYPGNYALHYAPTLNKLTMTLDYFKNNYYNNEHIEKLEWIKTHILNALEKSITILNNRDGVRNAIFMKNVRRYHRAIEEINKL